MKTFMNFKWLTAILLLCAPMTTRADDSTLSLDQNLGSGTGGSGWSCTYDTTTHVATFSGGYGAVSWWLDSNGVDYSDYAGVKIVFKTKETYNVTLEVVYAADESTNSEAYVTCSGVETDEQEIYVAFNSEYSTQVEQIYLQIGGYSQYNSETGNWDDITGETTVTLVSATLVSASSSDDGGQVNTTDYIITDENGDSYLNLAWTQTEDWLEQDTNASSGTLTHNNDATPLPTATLDYTRTYGGLGWSYPYGAYLNLSGYSQVDVSYTVTNSASVTMYIYDGSWSSITASGSNNTITFDLTSSDYSSMDFSNVTEIIFQTSAICTLTINSIKLTKGETSDVVEVDPIIIGNNGYNLLNLNWPGYETWGTGSISVENDEATLVFEAGDTGLGWEYYENDNGSLDLSSYARMVVKYSVEYTGTEPQIKLYLKDSSNSDYTSDAGSDGTITCALTGTSLSLSAMDQIVIEASSACTVTVTSIQLYKASSDYIVEKEVNGTTHYYLNLGVPHTTAWSGNSEADWSGSEVTGSNVGSITPADGTNPITASIEYDCYGGGLGWAFETNNEYLDLTGYYRLVVTYSEATGDTRSEQINTTLCLQDVNYNTISFGGSDATGTMSYTIDASGSFDPSQVRLVLIQCGTKCTLDIESMELVTKDDAVEKAEKDVDLSASRLYVWPGEENTEITILSKTDDAAVAKIETSTQWTGCSWWFGDGDEDDYWGVKVVINTNEYCEGQVIRLCVEYNTSDGGTYYETYSVIANGEGEQELLLPFLKEGDVDSTAYDHDVTQIYVMWGEVESGAEITIVSAELVGNKTFDADYVVITTSTVEGLGTYYNGSTGYKMPLGLKGATITGVESKKHEEINSGDNGTETDEVTAYELTTNYVYKNEDDDEEGGDIVPAGTPLLVSGTPDNSVLYYTGFVTDEATSEDSEKAEGNLLHGTDEDITDIQDMIDQTIEDDDAAEGTEYCYYMLTYGSATVTTKTTYEDGYNADNDPDGEHATTTTTTTYNDIGFYWATEANGSDGEGGAFWNGAHKAWLAIQKSYLEDFEYEEGTTTKLSGLLIGDGNGDEDEGEDETTGITNVPAESVQNATDGAIYNLQGVRVNDMSQKGVYIVGGRKIVKR